MLLIIIFYLLLGLVFTYINMYQPLDVEVTTYDISYPTKTTDLIFFVGNYINTILHMLTFTIKFDAPAEAKALFYGILGIMNFMIYYNIGSAVLTRFFGRRTP